MGQARQSWVLGGAAAGLFGFVAVAGHIAVAPHVVRVVVVDDRGPLPGVWVSLEDEDVQTTDASGSVVLKGRRFALDQALMTVSNPSTEQLYLSQSLRLSVSWKLWEKNSRIEVRLPRIEDSAPLSAGAESPSGELDLPLSGASAEFSSAQVIGGATHLGQLQQSPFREEILSAPEDDRQSPLAFEPHSASGSIEATVVDALFCKLLSIDVQTCSVGQTAARVPLALPSARSILERPLFAWANEKESGAMIAEAQRPPVFATLDTGRSQPAKTKSISSLASFKVNLSLDGRPLEGARVFMSRVRDSRVRELGVTNADGKIESKIPREFWGESFSVFHPCCSPKSFPTQQTKQVLTDGFSFEMQSGSGQGVLVQHEAYGVLRKIEQAEVFSKSGKLAVSGLDGFVFYNSTKTPEQVISKVVVKNSKPSEFLISTADGLQTRSEPMTYLVSSSQTYLPAMAVIERVDGKSFSGILKNSELRRWRRDFMARLMKLPSLRVVVSGEAENRVAAAGESLADIVSRGWSQTHLAGEWDLLLSVHYDENQGEVRLSAVNASGAEFYEHKQRLLNKMPEVLPESAARRTFDEFLTAVPFEGGIVRQQGNDLLLTFPSLQDFGLQAGSLLAIYQEATGATEEHRLSALAGFAVVEKQSEGSTVKARLTHINSVNRKTEVLPDVVRIAKISPEFFKAESTRKGLLKVPTLTSNSRQKAL